MAVGLGVSVAAVLGASAPFGEVDGRVGLGGEYRPHPHHFALVAVPADSRVVVGQKIGFAAQYTY